MYGRRERVEREPPEVIKLVRLTYLAHSAIY